MFGQHLVDIADLGRQQLTSLLDLSIQIAGEPGTFANRLNGKVLINLFLEPSTRTRISFEIAARRLGMYVINFQPESSSAVKGEALIDTFYTLQAMAPDVIAIRHSEDGLIASLAEVSDAGVHIINAGEGCSQHPTQALLDAVTLMRARGDLSGLTVTIAGDIRHSRVARSSIVMLKKLGVAGIRLTGPADLLPVGDIDGVDIFTRLEDALIDTDVVMMLRIQRERFGRLAVPDEKAYFEIWGLSPQRLGLASPDCLVLHPGPINRGIEIASEVVDGAQSLIREQVTNGVYTRMAVLLALAG
jgi:aspartate carbamoyltransferase catalytic subunit